MTSLSPPRKRVPDQARPEFRPLEPARGEISRAAETLSLRGVKMSEERNTPPLPPIQYSTAQRCQVSPLLFVRFEDPP